jgi:hypothetical protein
VGDEADVFLLDQDVVVRRELVCDRVQACGHFLPGESGLFFELY